MTISVDVRNNNVDKAMRILKKKLLKEGLMKELRDRKQFTKPSLVKREEKKQAIRRVKKEQRLKAIKDGY
jgi:small subunit ribosomal protein S21